MTTTTAPLAATWDPPIDTGRGNVRAAGIFYLLTFASSIPALLLIDPVLKDAGYIVGAGQAPACCGAASWTSSTR